MNVNGNGSGRLGLQVRSFGAGRAGWYVQSGSQGKSGEGERKVYGFEEVS